MWIQYTLNCVSIIVDDFDGLTQSGDVQEIKEMLGMLSKQVDAVQKVVNDTLVPAATKVLKLMINKLKNSKINWKLVSEFKF